MGQALRSKTLNTQTLVNLKYKHMQAQMLHTQDKAKRYKITLITNNLTCTQSQLLLNSFQVSIVTMNEHQLLKRFIF